MQKITEEYLSNTLIMFRGTIEEIERELKKLSTLKEVKLIKFEKDAEGADLGYNVALGRGDDYNDFEVFVLPTMVKDSFIITEINSF